MIRIASSLLLLATLSTANAQQFSVNEKSARVWGGGNGIVSNFKSPTGEATMNGNWLEMGAAYKFNDNFFGEIRYSKNAVDSVKTNGEKTNIDESWTSKEIGIGFRSARAGTVGKYFGAAYYQDIDGDESDSSSARVSLFLEKDDSIRLGRLGISRATKDATGTAIGGTHVWFLKSGIGLGLNWSYEAGKDTEMFGTEIKYTETSGGILLMFRL